MIVRCPGCDAPHESIYSASQHAWKSQDDEHAEYEDLDSALVAVMQENDVVDAVDPAVEEDVDGDGDRDDLEDVGDTPPNSPDPDTPEQSTATDGAWQSPPMPDLEDVDDSPDDDVDDLPDRYVPVADYVDAASDDLGDDEVKQLRDALEDYDVVDVEATTAENIVAHPIDEVTA